MKATTEKLTEHSSETTNTVFIFCVVNWHAFPLKNVVAGGVFNVLFFVHLGHMLYEVLHLKMPLRAEHQRKNELRSLAWFLEQRAQKGWCHGAANESHVRVGGHRGCYAV